MENGWGSIDIGNQIDNSWNKDTALALKIGKIGFKIKIRERDKKILEKKYLKNKEKLSRKNKRRIVIMIYSFLLYKFLSESNGLAKKVILCKDINPSKDFYRYLRYISSFYGEEPLDEKIKIKFKNNKDGNSKAHKLANDTYKGRKKPDYLIKKKDIEDLKHLIEKFIFSKDRSKTPMSS